MMRTRKYRWMSASEGGRRSAEERQELEALLQGGQKRVRIVKRAQILLAADAGRTEADIAETVSVGTATIYRIKKRFVEGGLQHALTIDLAAVDSAS